jgi:hypothetical protein
MNVRDLPCWPPTWRAAPGAAARAADGERGTLIAVRWNRENGSAVLTMEDDGDRYFAVLEGEVTVLGKLYRLLGWYIGRPLARIGSLELDGKR